MSRACTRCGTALQPGQEYCVECGARQGVAPRRPVHWLWPAGAAALVAAAAAAGAIAAGADEKTNSTIVALSRLRAAPPAQQGGRASKLRHWPHKDGYTIVLSAVPFTAPATAARARAKQAAKAGLPDVGLLESDRFASLHPGYVIVFSGVYPTLDEALAALPRAARAFPHAYVQEINR